MFTDREEVQTETDRCETTLYNKFIFIDCKVCYQCVLKLGYITQKKGEFHNALSICFIG